MTVALRTIVVENVALGPRNSFKRARVADPIDRLNLEQPERHAAMRFRQAWEHCQAGRGLGPMPWGRDEPRSRSGGPHLWPQERAMSAAECYRLGVQAMGLAAAEGVVNWVLLAEMTLSAYDAARKWKEGRGKEQLLAALARLAAAYGT